MSRREWRLTYNQTATERWYSDTNDRVREEIGATVAITGESGEGSFSDNPADLTCDAEFEFEADDQTAVRVRTAVARVLGAGRVVTLTEVES